MATYNRASNKFGPPVDCSSEPLQLFELALLKCLLTEVPLDVEYDALWLSVSAGRLKIICFADKVGATDTARTRIQEAILRCSLLNLVSVEKTIVIRRTP